ncbi:MAG: RNA methyltransferase [Rikenellaceae bacterium]|nr:RNA methyltransferase [Rikenellaceae bacterium]
MVSKADIALVRSLRDKKGRREHGLFVVEGRKLVDEAVRSGWGIERMYTAGAAAPLPGNDPGAEFSGVRAVTVSPALFERMSRLKSPQGVLALVRIPGGQKPRVVPGKLLLALDGIQDPGNLGTIVRIADWFGIQEILCSTDCADCFNPKVVQATMGSLFRVRVNYGDLEGWLREAAAAGIPLYGTFLDGENIYTSPLELSGIVTLGSEGSGISPGTAAHITRRLSVPSFAAGRGGAESLNVAAAAAVVVSEFRRRII